MSKELVLSNINKNELAGYISKFSIDDYLAIVREEFELLGTYYEGMYIPLGTMVIIDNGKFQKIIGNDEFEDNGDKMFIRIIKGETVVRVKKHDNDNLTVNPYYLLQANDMVTAQKELENIFEENPELSEWYENTLDNLTTDKSKNGLETRLMIVAVDLKGTDEKKGLDLITMSLPMSARKNLSTLVQQIHLNNVKFVRDNSYVNASEKLENIAIQISIESKQNDRKEKYSTWKFDAYSKLEDLEFVEPKTGKEKDTDTVEK